MSTSRISLVLLMVAACGTDSAVDPFAPRTLEFGPFPLAPGQEQADLCVAVTLHNDAPIYLNTAEMTGAPGIHHSNWFWVPDNDAFGFPEGAWKCSDGGGLGRPFDQAAAAVFGGVVFAQSTQVTHEVQAFPAGAAIKINANARIIATVHLVNGGDTGLTVPLALTITPIPETEVTTVLAGFSMENLAIALPPHVTPRFGVECDLSATWHNLNGAAPIDFKIYHALSHYHALGTALTFEAIRDRDGGVDTIWSTAAHIGDNLGGVLDPEFDMTGHSKLRLRCTYDNPNDTTIKWGNAGGEMCIAFAFTDSKYVWTAGVVTGGDPGPSVVNNGITDFTATGCTVTAVDATHPT